ncbi:MAG: hypothetical protein QW814_03415, partial [Methanothrix sp.]
MVFKKTSEDKNNVKSDESERFGTLSALIKTAYANGYGYIGDTLKSILDELNKSSKLFRLEEERRMDPDLEKILEEHKNITYV